MADEPFYSERQIADVLRAKRAEEEFAMLADSLDAYQRNIDRLRGALEAIAAHTFCEHTRQVACEALGIPYAAKPAPMLNQAASGCHCIVQEGEVVLANASCTIHSTA